MSDVDDRDLSSVLWDAAQDVDDADMVAVDMFVEDLGDDGLGVGGDFDMPVVGDMDADADLGPDVDMSEERDMARANAPDMNVIPPPQTPLTLTSTYFRADATTTRGVSAWGTQSYPPGLPSDVRTTLFWGRFGDGGCASPGYGLNIEHPVTRAGVVVFRAAHPECGASFGPSFEADVHAFGAPQHLLRTEVTPGGAFQAFGESGQNASGANPFIHAAYVSFEPSWRSHVPHRLRPWGGPSVDPNQARVAVRVRESVTEDLMEEQSAQQLQQVVRLLVINEACDISLSRSFCQLEFNFKTYIRGVHAYTSFGVGDVINDGGQGGLIAVVGPIAGNGMSTSVLGAPTWTSWGASTQQAPFQDTTFQVEITWEQFQQLLVRVTQGDPASVFGPMWNDRSSWVLLSIGYGQENYNSSATSTSVIEGMFESLEVFAL